MTQFLCPWYSYQHYLLYSKIYFFKAFFFPDLSHSYTPIKWINSRLCIHIYSKLGRGFVGKVRSSELAGRRPTSLCRSIYPHSCPFHTYPATSVSRAVPNTEESIVKITVHCPTEHLFSDNGGGAACSWRKTFIHPKVLLPHTWWSRIASVESAWVIGCDLGTAPMEVWCAAPCTLPGDVRSPDLGWRVHRDGTDRHAGCRNLSHEASRAVRRHEFRPHLAT